MKNKSGGFTVVELLIAVGLVGVLVPSLYLAVNSINITNKRSRNIFLANVSVENKIEKLRSGGYNSIPTGELDFTNELPAELPKPNKALLKISASEGKKIIDVSINFQDAGRQRSTQYKTIISETGIGQ